MTLVRRDMLALTLGATLVPRPAEAQTRPDTARPSWPPPESFALWPEQPPGASSPLPIPHPQITGLPGEYHDIWMRGTGRPDVGVFRAARPDGRAVLVAPGGGYSFVSLRGEGIDVARALNPRGITVFVLNYRLPGEGWANRANVPLQDAQRAMRIIRAGASGYRIDPRRLGVLGFSAGGHLAASLATLHRQPVYQGVDGADRQSARPAFAGLMYAVASMEVGRSHGGSRANLLGPDPDPAIVRRYSADQHLTADTPPLFIAHARDDATVPVVNSEDLYAAARPARVPVEAHFFARGGHGFGARLPPDYPAALWPELFDRWLRETLARG